MNARIALIAGTAIAMLASGPARAVDAPLREDRIRFVVHDLVAGQLTADQLGNYLQTVRTMLHGSQEPAIDVPTCTDLGTVTDGGSPPVLFTSGGGLADGLAVIENAAEFTAVLDWAETQGDRVAVFVQDIQWCGAPVNAIGCAPTPGDVIVVALDAAASLLPMVIAHERAHNAGLSHRTDDSCALMQPTASSTHGCLNQGEAKAFYNQADIAISDTCECINVQFMGPNQTWSLNPQGASCDDDDVCSVSSSCDVGLCAAGPPLDCSDGVQCTYDLCDAIAGCSNPAIPDGLICDFGDICDGIELCLDGVCGPGIPFDCDDGLFCNGVESCDSQVGCQPGTPPALGDGVACTDDSCDEDADAVVHVANDANCDDAMFCNGSEFCDAVLDCQIGTSPSIDDGVVCTEDSCDDVADVVVNAPNDANCDDALFCNGSELCDPMLDCQPGTPPTVDDGVACTDDSCDDVAGAVIHLPNPDLCDDSDPCTAESCDPIGGCASDPIPLCSVEIAATPGWSRMAIGVLLVGLAAVLLRRGRSS